ncbi:DNA ligase D [Mesorhizobium sp. ANAO-SY3R2]|uniref:DNA ligase D n=1 Tax=Mesorhizobium sp. ANAO-SY3R2 TaxID=3166644 RepID=UPI00366D07DD
MAAEKLRTYRAKRDFTRTGEPRGSGQDGGGDRFVVHKHHATANHYDLRLELDGVLKCWAVPRGPSLNPADRRLAVETEDHPLEYIDFEGVIPEGQYGAGPMIVWDTGVWAPMNDAHAALGKGAFKFRLWGEKLRGGWMLTRLEPRRGEDKRNWLLIKEYDLAENDQVDILAARSESVKSGRPIEDLVPARKPPAKPEDLRPGTLAGAVRSAMPARIAPQLATAVESIQTGQEWLHEIKFDGYRTMAHVAGGATRLITRSGLDWTRRYGALPLAFRSLPCTEAIVDGEIVVVDDKGISRFSALQEALASGHDRQLVFYAFDLLFLNGWDLTKAPLVQRKALLEKLLAGHVDARSPIQYSDHVIGNGKQFYDRVSEMGLEGIVSKLAAAPYVSGRTRSWTKTKALQRGDFVITGYTTSKATGGLGSLALGEWADGELEYRGKVGTGFDAATLDTLLHRLEALRDDATRLERAPKEVIPVRPVLTARVHYANKTADNALRHAVFKGLREAELSANGPAIERKRLISDADLAGISITNPTRRLLGKAGPTKLDIAVYYAAVGDFMLPHLLGRPVSLFRCPSSRLQDCFFQRHAFSGMPASIASFETKNSDDETKTYIAVEDARGYLALAQFGVVEFHVWGALRKQLEKPDRVVFDLDPGEGIGWREVVEAAVHVRGELEGMGLVPFVKTSGGRGIHVVVPMKRRLGWKQVHQASGAISARIAASAPGTFTTVMGKENRKQRIFIDYHRNARSATAAAPYSLRARPHMPASTPLAWSDLESIDAPEDLNYSSLPGLLAKSGDPWTDIEDHARDLPAEYVNGGKS